MYCNKNFEKKHKIKILCTVFLCIIICCVMGGCKTKKENEMQEEAEIQEDDTESFDIANFDDIEGVARVKNISGQWGFIDQNGVEIIECQYDAAKEFAADGLVIVGSMNDSDAYDVDGYSWGVVDWSGNEIIPIQYAEVFIDAEEDLIWVENQYGSKEVLSYSGEKVTPVEYYDYMEEKGANGWRRVYVEEGKDKDGLDIYKYGYVNKEGEVIKCQYASATDFDADGHAVVSKLQDGVERYMLINESGEIVKEYEHSYVKGFNENGISLFRDYAGESENGFINKDGEIILKTRDWITDREIPGELMEIDSSDGYQYVTDNGEIIDCQYDSVYEFASNGLSKVSITVGHREGVELPIAKYGFINQDMKEVIPLQYDWATEFQENGLALVGYCAENATDKARSMKYGYINEKGEVVIPFQYDCYDGFDWDEFSGTEKLAEKGLVELRQFCGNDIYSDYDYKYGVADAEGNIVLDCKCDYLLCDEDSDVLVVGYLLNDGETEEESVYRCEYVDFEGNTVLQLSDEYVYAGCLFNVKK